MADGRRAPLTADKETQCDLGASGLVAVTLRSLDRGDVDERVRDEREGRTRGGGGGTLGNPWCGVAFE